MAESDASFAAFKRALAIAGTQDKFASMIGCSQGNIAQLIARKSPLPGRYVLKAEAGTGVSRHDLRPDLYPRDSGAPSPTVVGDQLEPLR